MNTQVLPTVSRSVYEPNPVFLMENPKFSMSINFRMTYMQGMLDLMDEDEKISLVRREIAETFVHFLRDTK